MLDDLILFNQIRKGDVKSFEKIFRKYYLPLYYYSLSIVKGSDIAEEIVQELFYTFWKNKEELKIQLSLKSYLYKSVFNQSLQHLKHYSIRDEYKKQVSEKNESSQSPTPINTLEYKELETIINATINRLPQRRKKIFLMHRKEHLKYKEIADTLSISIKTVEAEMTKAYKELRHEIEKYTRL